MEALGVLALRLRCFPTRQLCSRCFTSLYRASAMTRGFQTSLASRRICSSDGVEKELNEASHGSQLIGRSLVLVKGLHANDLLQGLMTNDIEQFNEVKGQRAIYTMFLNKQGRVLYDVICYQWDKDPDGKLQSYVLECDSAISQDLQKHLKIYRIRKKVDITSLDSEYQVWSTFSPGSTSSPTTEPESTQSSASSSFLFFSDPRVDGLGQRVIVPKGNQDTVSGITKVREEDYMTHRYAWGVAEGVNELPPGECLPLESNLELMNGVSFTKGCYLGQELTARTHHTGVIRKRVMPIKFCGNVPTITAASSIKTAEGKNVGKLRCHLKQNGLALLRTALIGNKLKVASEDGVEAELEAHRPAWWPEDLKK